ncbi:hypothetical protein L1049_016955 [Liquidambar formosana]|uniref:Pentatricopeptide repeat-containing protein n=1 Tax=Liquidambar formosana TaxID=63359 RepID=A0AAP0S6E1_LIQFO
MITTGLTLHTYPLSRLLLISSTLAITYAFSIFNHITNPTIFLFNTLISSLITTQNHHTNTHLAFSLYIRILTHDTLKPNSYTFPSLFKACGSHPWLNHGRALHTHVLKFLEPTYDDFVQASLLNFYAKCGKVGVSRPNEVTLVALIGACADLGMLSQGAWAHVYVLKNNLRLNRFVGTALIDMYSKCGCLALAYQLFDQLPQRDTLCYNAMIGGFAIHGNGHQAVELFKKMRLEGLIPDEVTLVVAMFGCSHVGLVEEGCEIFDSMREVYGIEPKLEHYGCLVDLLGRAGTAQGG